MGDIRFFERAEVIVMHDMLIGAFGGSYGIRDLGLLDSALSQPQITFGSQLLHPDVPSMAAAYLFHIIQNHPFIDGNKRTGAFVAIAFARLNGFELSIANAELHRIAVDVATSKLSKDDLIALFSRILKPKVD